MWAALHINWLVTGVRWAILAIIIALVLYRDNRRQVRPWRRKKHRKPPGPPAGLGREPHEPVGRPELLRECPHCGAAFPLGPEQQPGGVVVCPRCRMIIDDGTYA